MATAGSIVVDLLMRTGAFETDTKRAEDIAKKRAAAIDKAFAEVGRNIGLAATAAGGAIAAMVVSTANAAKEISNLAQISGSGTEEFQRFAAGAKTVGIEQDKLGDIFKDFREKVGEFVQTGGGGMKDFFEQIAPKVGVTADAFRNLSGPQALQLYVDTLQKAGLSQEQMSFYLESMASDTTALIPLLRDGGKEMTALGDAAAQTGQIMNGQTIYAAKELSNQMDQLKGMAAGVRNEIAGALIPSLVEVGNQMKVVGSQGSAVTLVASGIATVFETVTALGVNVGYVLKQIRNEIGGIGAQAAAVMRGDFAQAAEIGRMMKADAAAARAQVDKDTEAIINARNKIIGTGSGVRGAGFVDPRILGTTPVAETVGAWVPPTKPGKTNKPKAEKSEKSEAERNFEAIQQQIAALNAQAATFGMSEKAATLWSLANDGATEAQLKQAGATLDQIEMLKFLEEEMKRAADEQDRLNQLLEATPTAKIKEMSADVDILKQAFDNGMISMDQYVEAVQTRLGTLPEQVGTVANSMDEFAKSAAQNMQSAFADFLFDPFKDGLGGMLKGFGQMIQRMIAEAASAQLMGMLFGNMGKTGEIGGLVGQGLNWLGAAFGGARASGGSVATGHAYLVGERGPEMFVPSTAGAIVPNGAAAGGQRSEYNISVTVPAGSPQETRRAAAAGAREALGFLNQAGRYA